MDEGKDEENNNEANEGSWWGSWPTWLQAAKEKSSSAYEFMKRDLTEFSHVVQNDAVAAVSSTAAMLKEKLTVDTAESVAGKARQSLTSVLGTISDVFAPQRELEDAELMIIKNSEPIVMDWWQSQLYIIRKDPKTYCHEPEGPPEVYENWLESFDPDEHQEEMTEIIITCSEVRALYDKLVPAAVSHLEFWQRYFYRIHLLRKAEAKRADLMRRAEEISIDDIQWDEDEELNNDSHTRLYINKSTDQKSSKTFQNGTVTTEENIPHFNLNPKPLQTVIDEDVGIGVSQDIPGRLPKDSVVNENSLKHIKLEEGNNEAKNENTNGNLDVDIVAEVYKNKVETSAPESTDGSRSSPIESIGKDYSTGDEWEKDFDLEITENDLKKTDTCQKSEPRKEGEDDWENWQ